MKTTCRGKQRHARENPVAIQVLSLRYMWQIAALIVPSKSHLLVYTTWHSPLPRQFLSWPCDLLCPVGHQQMWWSRGLKSTYALDTTLPLAAFQLSHQKTRLACWRQMAQLKASIVYQTGEGDHHRPFGPSYATWATPEIERQTITVSAAQNDDSQSYEQMKWWFFVSLSFGMVCYSTISNLLLRPFCHHVKKATVGQETM